jgi:hypothetical protein
LLNFAASVGMGAIFLGISTELLLLHPSDAVTINNIIHLNETKTTAFLSDSSY